MPHVDETALACSHGNTSSAFLIVFVVATVSGDVALALNCVTSAHAENQAHAWDLLSMKMHQDSRTRLV